MGPRGSRGRPTGSRGGQGEGVQGPRGLRVRVSGGQGVGLQVKEEVSKGSHMINDDN